MAADGLPDQKPMKSLLRDGSWATLGLALLVAVFDLAFNSCQMPIQANFYRLLSQKPSPPPPAVIAVQSIAVNPPSLNYDLVTANPQHLTVVFTPTNATNKTVGWSVPAGSKVVVTPTGPSTADVTAAPGTLVTDLAGPVTAASQDGGKTAACLVSFTNTVVAVTSVSIAPTTLALTVGEVPQPLVATVAPTNATDKNVIWTSGQAAVATVDTNGNVTAVGVGTATIKAASNSDNTKFATTTVTVTDTPVTAVALDHPTLAIAPAGTATLTATTSPAGASDSTVTWTSDNSTVTLTGPTHSGDSSTITVNAGSLTTGTVFHVKATSHQAPGLSATSTITIGLPATSVVLNQTSLGLGLNESGSVTATHDGLIQWSLVGSSAVATIDANTGVIHALSAGTVQVTAQSVDGSATAPIPCTVTVYDLNSTTTPVPLVGGGQIATGTPVADGATVAVDPTDGSVYIAYVDSTLLGSVAKASGAAWTPLGGNFSANPVNITSIRDRNLSLAVDQGTPYIAYTESGTDAAFVKKYDGVGQSWVTVGPGQVSTGSATYLSLAFDSSHNPFLGFIEGANANNPSLLLMSGGTWGQVGTFSVAFANPFSSYSVVAFDASHSLSSGSSPTKDYYMAFVNGGGTPITQLVNFPDIVLEINNDITTNAAFLDLAIQNSRAYLAYQDPNTHQAVLFRQDSASFDSHVMSTARADYVALAVDPRNGTAYVAYADSTAGSFVNVSKLDGNAAPGTPGTLIVNLADFPVNAIKCAFYVDTAGRGHLYVCYGVSSPGGILVKDFLR